MRKLRDLQGSQDGAPHHWEWTGPDGRNYDIYDFPFTDVDGSPLIMEVGLDITERKQAEKELEKHREHLEELVRQRTDQLLTATAQAQQQAEIAMEAADTIRHLSRFPEEDPNPVLRIARDGTILYANPVSGPFLAHWGLAAGQSVSDDWTQGIAAIIDAGKIVENEIECAGRIFSCQLTPIAEEGYVNIYGHDVTEGKHAEEALSRARPSIARCSRTCSTGSPIAGCFSTNTAIRRISSIWPSTTPSED